MLPPGEETVNAQLGAARGSSGIAPNRAIGGAFMNSAILDFAPLVPVGLPSQPAIVPPYGKTSLRSASRVSISARLSSKSPASEASITENSSAASVKRVTVT
jgi:hypothetical protein